MLCLGATELQGVEARMGKERVPARVITLSSIFPFSSFDGEGAKRHPPPPQPRFLTDTTMCLGFRLEKARTGSNN